MGQIIQQALAEHGALVVIQYVLMIPLVTSAVVAAWRAVGNVLR